MSQRNPSQLGTGADEEEMVEVVVIAGVTLLVVGLDVDIVSGDSEKVVTRVDVDNVIVTGVVIEVSVVCCCVSGVDVVLVVDDGLLVVVVCTYVCLRLVDRTVGIKLILLLPEDELSPYICFGTTYKSIPFSLHPILSPSFPLHIYAPSSDFFIDLICNFW